MSLHLHNPYIVSMQGSLKTGPSLSSFPVLCGGKDGVCEHQPSKSPHPPQSMPEHGKEAVEPVKEAASNWKKQIDNDGKFYYWNSGTKEYTYSKPDGYIEDAADKWEKQLVEEGKFIYVNHGLKLFSYTKPEGWSENAADTEATQNAADTEATQNAAESQAAQNAESQESSRFKHCTAFYLPVEYNFLVSYLNTRINFCAAGTNVFVRLPIFDEIFPLTFKVFHWVNTVYATGRLPLSTWGRD